MSLPEAKEGKFLIFRNLVSSLECVELSDIQYAVLKSIDRDLSFEQALEEAFKDLDEEDVERIGQEIGNWFSQWVSWGIFRLDKI
ncbi:MAG: hypothetical protein MK132_25600 [Lentisphaerales bacterium]|nr:hypothetical protein [Lentisphaerales bacterium]